MNVKANFAERARNTKYLNKEHISKMTAGLIGYYADPEKRIRLNDGLCKYCYYVQTSRIGGCAITHRNCDNCGDEMVFGNTCTDVLCKKCAVEIGYCKHCGQKLD